MILVDMMSNKSPNSHGCYSSISLTNPQNIQFDDVFIPRAQSIEGRDGRRFVQIDAGDSGLCAFEDDVLHLLHVDLFRFDCIEHLGQHAGPIAMTHYQTMRSRSASGEINYIWHLTSFFK